MKRNFQILMQLFKNKFFGNSINTEKLSFSDKIIKACKNKSNIDVFDDVYFSPVSFLTILRLSIN